MNSVRTKMVVSTLLVSVALFTSACGKENPSAGIPLQSNPLAGPSQALRHGSSLYFAQTGLDLFGALLGVRTAQAAVNAFNTFKVCVSEVVWELASGTSASSSTAPLKPGLLTFSPTATEAATIGNLDLQAGTALKNIKFTLATKPEICAGADYAVLFNSDSTGGDRKVTQDMSFSFEFPVSGYIVENDQPITLFLGDIVNGLAALGAGLDNSSIQGVNVGQAR
ncbi:MAG: hypothetical protein NDJ90_10860 [Oligoflexia bacterium]|nr:hypothetical protein [Oligoflexia bacterium]